MKDRKLEFFKNLIISDEDKIRAEKFLFSKGIEKHIILKETLFHWIEGEKMEYAFIASTYRYDKRIRNLLFKYISYLEEYFRAIILDKYNLRKNKTELCNEIRLKLKEFNGDLNDALEHIDFSCLLYQIEWLIKKNKVKCQFINKQKLRENFHALKELRNAVMHNKFLILYRGFEICYINNEAMQSATLKANILNLTQFLPNEISQKCKEEITNCQFDHAERDVTKWMLPPSIIIKLK